MVREEAEVEMRLAELRLTMANERARREAILRNRRKANCIIGVSFFHPILKRNGAYPCSVHPRGRGNHGTCGDRIQVHAVVFAS